MNAVEIIRKKRDGLALSRKEIRAFIEGYMADRIPDYQAAAWLMAVYLRGMQESETIDLTMALAESGEIIDLSSAVEFAVNKHSSGGVGDKTTLVVLPLVAACGVPVAKLSGRGLAFTGGTLDKLESIDGYDVNLTQEQFLEHARRYGIVLSGQTGDLAPADGKLYALRDVTATVASSPLIASSIMSKKIAAGADGIVLDVKTGSGAFMATVEEARELAALMVRIGQGVDLAVTALISDMNQPLGQAVGNALEVREAIAALSGEGPHDLVQHSIEVAGHMLRLAGQSAEKDLSDIRPTLEKKLQNGEALEKFKTLVRAQGGDVSQVEDPARLPAAPVIRTVAAPEGGTLAAIDARAVGLAAMELGAGRQRKGETVDHAVGLLIFGEVGREIEQGAPLFEVHARSEDAAEHAARAVLAAHEWGEAEPLPLFYDTLFSAEGRRTVHA